MFITSGFKLSFSFKVMMMTKKNHTNFKPFVIIFILIIAFIIGIQIFGAARFETILASQGEVIDGFWTEALIVRDEKVIRAPSTGRVELLVGEGDRLASGRKQIGRAHV